MYRYESWTIKKAECQRIDAFELVLKKTFESPLDCKEIKPVIWICAAEGFKADESSCTLKPEVFRVKATAQEYAHQHSTGGPKSHERQNKRNY